MTTELDGRTVLILGGTVGIGLATAKAFAACGARVAITGRDPERGAAALEQLHGKDTAYFEVDVRQTDSIDEAVRRLVDRWGKLDCAFNNAGWEGVAGPLEQTSEADWLRMIDIKLNGVWRCMRSEIREMRKGGSGTIVNMAGNWGLIGFPNFAAYCAAAHGVVGMTKAAALEVADAGLRVNAVCPGAVDAPMLDRMAGGGDAIKQSFGEHLAIGRICTAAEVANAVVWLCSGASSYVNGAAMPLDGGGQ